jgi:polar amino acid transport system substrate-binding protein
MVDTGNFPPCSYIAGNGKLTGLDIEIASLFAQAMGMQLDIQVMDYEAIIPYIVSGKADMTACGFVTTDERMANTIMGEPFVITGSMLITKGSGSSSVQNEITYRDFTGKNVGCTLGGVYDVIAEDFGAVPAFFNDSSSGIEAVVHKNIDGYLLDTSAVRVIVSQNDALTMYEVPSEIFSAPMGAISENQTLVDEFNEFLSGITDDGTFAEMQERWLNNVPDLSAEMPVKVPESGSKGTIKIAVSGTEIPFCYLGENNELKGYTIELMNRFAEYAGYKIDYSTMEFSGFIPAVVSGRADFAVSNISITEERKKEVLFTDPIYVDTVSIIALKPEPSADKDDGGFKFISWVKNSFQKNLITENRYKMLIDGLLVTLNISLLALLFGTVIGGFVTFLLTRKNKFVQLLARLYCGLIHGTPVVVLLMIAYYIIFAKTDISGVLIAVAAFSLVVGADVGGNLRLAISTVDPVEIEAARSLGFSKFGTFTKVTLPQAIKIALPGYLNGFVELVKATAVVGYIAIQDLTRAGDIIRSRTYDAFFLLLFVAIIYLIITTLFILIFKWIIRRLSK